MCGGSILSCCPRNPHGHERALKEEEDHCQTKIFSQSYVHLLYPFQTLAIGIIYFEAKI